MDPKVSLPHSQVSVTCPYLQPDQSIHLNKFNTNLPHNVQQVRPKNMAELTNNNKKCCVIIWYFAFENIINLNGKCIISNPSMTPQPISWRSIWILSSLICNKDNIINSNNNENNYHANSLWIIPVLFTTKTAGFLSQNTNLPFRKSTTCFSCCR